MRETLIFGPISVKFWSINCIQFPLEGLLVKHGAHGARSSRKTKILYNKIHCLLLQIFVIINKVFSRFTRWGSKKIGLLKNIYAKLPKGKSHSCI
jgi:hypothetical protein